MNSSLLQSKSTDFSVKSIETKINKALNPKSEKAKLKEAYSGSCGENAFWRLDTNAGILTIFGSGEMKNYDRKGYYDDTTTAPWVNYKKYIKSVEIRDGITSIGDWAFGSIYSKDHCGITYDIGYPNLKSIIIPNSVTEVGQHALKRWRSNSLTLPKDLLHIGEGAFWNSNGLTAINIPDSVVDINAKAFQYCYCLTSVSLGKGVKNIASDAFADCPKLTSVTLNNDYAVTNFRSIFPQYASLTSITLGEGVTTIPGNTFMGCEKLKSITIPSSVESIGNYAFAFCSSLTDINYSETNNIDFASNAFDDCPNLNTVKVSETYKDDNFCGFPITICGICGNNVSWELQTSTGKLTISGSGSMINCTPSSPAPWNSHKSKITYIVVENGVTSVGNNVFSSCENLDNIIITDSVISIGDNAFSDCGKLTSASIPDGVTSIGNSAFLNCENLTTLSIGATVQSIGSNAFSNCDELSSVSYFGLIEPTNDNSVFEQCENLIEVNVPSTYKDVTFCNKSVAKTIIIPDISTETSSSNINSHTSDYGDSDSEKNSNSNSTSASTVWTIIGSTIGAIVAAVAAGGIIIKCRDPKFCSENSCHCNC